MKKKFYKNVNKPASRSFGLDHLKTMILIIITASMPPIANISSSDVSQALTIQLEEDANLSKLKESSSLFPTEASLFPK